MNGLYRQPGFFHAGSSPLPAQVTASRRPASAGAATCSGPFQTLAPSQDINLRRRPVSAGGRAVTDGFRRTEGTGDFKFAYVRYAAIVPGVPPSRCKSGTTKCKLPWRQEKQVVLEKDGGISSGVNKVCLRGMHLAEHATNIVLQTWVAGFTVRGTRKGAKATTARRNVLLERVHPPGAFAATAPRCTFSEAHT